MLEKKRKLWRTAILAIALVMAGAVAQSVRSIAALARALCPSVNIEDSSIKTNELPDLFPFVEGRENKAKIFID